MSDVASDPTPVAAGERREAVRSAASTGGILGVLVWPAAVIAIACLPLLLTGGAARTMMSLIGILVVFALSYNMLLGQTGLLSFGHAVYYGLGAFMTVHAMNALISAQIKVPLPLLPLVGAVSGLGFALLFGWLSTRRAGTVFAMISLGLAELVSSSSLILRSFFGGEEGISTNRTKVGALFGYTFGPQIEMYYLIAGWAVVAAALMYWITLTPLGRMCNAVRDNPQRTEFVGYDPRIVRYMAFCLSGFFAGLAGGLAAINFELANTSFVGLHQSGVVLLATYIGGVGHFIGPIIGAMVVGYLQTSLSDVTEVWQLYFGVMFVAVVMYLPGGLAGALLSHVQLARAGQLHRLLLPYAVISVPAAWLLAGAVLLIEMVAHVALHAKDGSTVRVLGSQIDTAAAGWWLAAGGLLLAGALGCWLARRLTAPAWSEAVKRAAQRGMVVA